MKALLLLLILGVTNAQALEFGRAGGTFTMTGSIEEGDSANFLFELYEWDVPPTVFFIDSTGGSLNDAMLIGDFIRRSYIPVWSGDKCYSACVFIYIAGAEREAQGEIGLHRPYFDKNYFANLTPAMAEEKYKEIEQDSIKYLKKMGVSQIIIERIFNTGSTEVDILTPKEALIAFGETLPFYEEWLTAKCGKYTEEQSRVLNSWSNLIAARATLQVARNDALPKSDDFGSNFPELMRNAQLAIQMEKAGMLQPYIELSNVHNKCIKKAEDSHAYAFHRAVKSELEDIMDEIIENDIKPNSPEYDFSEMVNPFEKDEQNKSGWVFEDELEE
jgi:hypothetical protein